MTYESQMLIDWEFIQREIRRTRLAFYSVDDLKSICGEHANSRFNERLRNLQDQKDSIVLDAIQSAYDLCRRNDYSLLVPYLFNGGLEKLGMNFTPELQLLIPIHGGDGFLPICANWSGKVRARTLLGRCKVLENRMRTRKDMAVAYAQLKDKNLLLLAHEVIDEFRFDEVI